jgi:hypothetical protein
MLFRNVFFVASLSSRFTPDHFVDVSNMVPVVYVARGGDSLEQN